MKVLHIVFEFSIGGKELVVRDLVFHSGPGIESMVCVLKRSGPLTVQVREKGYKVFFLDIFNRKLPFRTIVLELANILRKEKIDVIHCHDIGGWFFGMLAKWISPTRKIFYTRHSMMEEPNWKKLLLVRFLARFTPAIVAVSPEVKQSMVSFEKIPERKIGVVFNGIDLAYFSGKQTGERFAIVSGISETDFVCGSVTRFFPVKNIEMQVDMVERLKSRIPGFKHLIVAPMNEHGESLAKEIAKRKLEKNIILTGFRSDIPRILKAMDVFVMTSISEATSIAILEAMAAGLPVVASRVGGNPNLVHHMVNGLLFDVNSLDDFCDQILRLYEDTQLRQALSRRTRSNVRQFSVEEMAGNYEALYKQKEWKGCHIQ